MGEDMNRQDGLLRVEQNVSYDSILVYVGELSPSDNLVRCAVSVANRLGAKICGVTTPLAPRDHPSLSIMEDPIHDALIYASMQSAGERFKDLTALAVNGVNWTWAEMAAVDALERACDAADLIMVNPSYVTPRPAFPSKLFSSALTLGRPVLVMPWASSRLEMDRIAICWNNSAQCRRAISDAMPFLVRAKKVTLIHFLTQTDEIGARTRLDEVSSVLAGKGVATGVHILPRMTGRLPKMLVEPAESMDANLIVAGAYGRGPLQMTAFGSLTDALVKSSQTALFLSR